MESLHTTATRSLRALLEHQPTSAAKVTFAWRIAAGPALGRAAEASWQDDGGVLRVRTAQPEWRREIERARPIIRARLDEILGPGVVRSLVIEEAPPAAATHHWSPRR